MSDIFEVYSSKQLMLRMAQAKGARQFVLTLVSHCFLVYPEMDFSQAAECK